MSDLETKMWAVYVWDSCVSSLLSSLDSGGRGRQIPYKIRLYLHVEFWADRAIHWIIYSTKQIQNQFITSSQCNHALLGRVLLLNKGDERKLQTMTFILLSGHICLNDDFLFCFNILKNLTVKEWGMIYCHKINTYYDFSDSRE